VKTTNTTTNTTTSTTKLISDNKLAFCAGINDYVGTHNDLQGCVNDAKEWGSLLRDVYGFKVKTLLNQQVTYASYTEIIGNMICDSRAGNNLVITYSGHGTNMPDNNGDESDGRDEALCLYDGYLIDDSIRDIFKNLHTEATLTFISDSCHSGTVTRSFITAMHNEEPLRTRYMPPENDVEAFSTRGSDIKSKIFYPEEGMNEILIAGCLPTEYSYDAYIGGKYRGAMSYYAINILRKYPTITYENFYHKLCQSLPSRKFPQTPQLEGSAINKQRIMFR
jgi:metacaspase-1